VEERNESSVTAPTAAPTVPELEQARAAFTRGDFRETRRLATLLMARTDITDDTRKEADHLLASTSNDPLAVFLGVGCLLFFVIVVYFTLVR
jgi:hypothetical protein